MSTERHGRRGSAAWRYRDYRLYWFAEILSIVAIDMQITGVAWHVYQLTGEPLSLGLVGLAQFVPFLLLFLVSGAAADRFHRVRIFRFTAIAQVGCAAAFLLVTVTGAATFPVLLAILVVLGVAHAFQTPVSQAIVPLLVPPQDFGNAVAWTALGGGVARIAGPAGAGGLLLLGQGVVYGTAAALFLVTAILAFLIRATGQVISRDRPTLEVVLGGFRFIRSRRVVLGAISLDLFAVLFGGATALLPIFAVDILGVGALGYGALRVAHVVGALTTALILTQRPITRRAGPKLLTAVAVFGAAICVFGISGAFLVSFVALFVLGAADEVNVFIRHNVVQLATPDEMRGRVTAVSTVFVGASNELGEFESGLTAAWWGVVPAVLVGGLATLLVAALFAVALPELRKLDSLAPEVLADGGSSPLEQAAATGG